MASSSWLCKRKLFLGAFFFYTQKSLILSYMSYCDFYFPIFFILESVHNYVLYNII